MKTIDPFANEAESIGIGDLTIENRSDRVAIYGTLDITRDKPGLAQARRLKENLDRILQVLEADKELPDRLPPPGKSDKAPNPF